MRKNTPEAIEFRNFYARIDFIADLLKDELKKAVAKHPPMQSPHEGYAIIKEELEELWGEVKCDNGRKPVAMNEAMQIAVVGLRYILDLREWK